MDKISREESFGRLLAIANVLGWRVFDKHRPSISAKYSTRLAQKPAHTFKLIHEELMQYSYKFGADEMYLMDMFGEVLSDMDFEDFNNEKLSEEYLLHRGKEQNWLFRVMSAEEASEHGGFQQDILKT
ncbi:type I-C CRISPR-associated protein Cas8c/Csd1 [Geomicrobium sp. JCM 19038]|uniref:type I-C CRISPR-associated protein Cas8c/Csd1 n=1 Tax=Geomicrobium sp. JCM 19038 TaxID=1460635 RepID=UPI001EE666CD|nr:type I-C CRISPR-associated protein Cas8c/Csd1 [Geomicrobium sp. JCM 19038]